MRKTLLLRVIAGVTGGAIAAAVGLAVVPHYAITARGSFGHEKSAAMSQLTRAEVRELSHLTPAQAARLDKALGQGFGKLGIQAGLGNTNSSTPGKVQLTAYDWSGGLRWDHAWVTASYADLAPYVDAVASVGSFMTRYDYIFDTIFNGACLAVGLATDGWGGAVCSFLTSYIASAAANVSGTLEPLPNHGVWAAYYWFSNSLTGGYW